MKLCIPLVRHVIQKLTVSGRAPLFPFAKLVFLSVLEKLDNATSSRKKRAQKELQLF